MGHLFSDHRYYCSETCQRNTRLNCARRMHEKRFMRMQAHPHSTTFTLWTLKCPAMTSTASYTQTWTPTFPSFLSRQSKCTDIFKYFPYLIFWSYLSIVNIFVYPSCQILFFRDTCTWNIFFSLKYHLWKSDHSKSRKQTYSTCLKDKWSLELVPKGSAWLLCADLQNRKHVARTVRSEAWQTCLCLA